MRVIAKGEVIRPTTIRRDYETASWYTDYEVRKGETVQFIHHHDIGVVYARWDEPAATIVADYLSNRVLHREMRVPSRVGREGNRPNPSLYMHEFLRKMQEGEGEIAVLGIDFAVTLTEVPADK